jgi:hypothetical protein
VAAAAAIVAIVVAVVATFDHPKHRPGASTGPTTRATASTKPPKLAYALGGRVPPYYVWTTFTSNPNLNYVRVRLTATGAVLGTVKAAAGGTIVGVTGAADDRTFVLDEQRLATGNANQAWEPHTYYLLRLTASGVPSSVTQLPITEPSGALVTGVTLSPDARKLAVAIQPNDVKSEPNLTDLKIYSIATGAVLRTWSGNGTIGFSGEREALTWSSDQRTLGFVWLGNSQDSKQGEWLLNLTLNGTDLIGNSRQAISLINNLPFGCQSDLIITPDGSAVVCGASPNNSNAAPATVFYEFSTANGTLTRTLAQVSGSGSPDVLWSNPSGSVLIGAAGQNQIGMVTAGSFTPLPALAYGEAAQGTW